MRNRLIFMLVLSVIGGCASVAAQPWATGKLALYGQSYDGYQVYKVVISVDGDREAILWNFSGSFKAACKGSERCEVAARVIDFMLKECKASVADLCMSEIPIGYSLSICAGKYPCLGLAFPKDPLKDQTRKTIKIYFASESGSFFRPKAEVDADLRNVCVVSLASASCPQSPSSVPSP